MMAAKSTKWSYLKRAWDNDLAFERASRSLAKTGCRVQTACGASGQPLASVRVASCEPQAAAVIAAAS